MYDFVYICVFMNVFTNECLGVYPRVFPCFVQYLGVHVLYYLGAICTAVT